ncbi:MAG: nuclear transport factor 2 family protein [Ferrovibrionaceae bacterium]
MSDHHQPTHRWSVDAFARFWARPTRPELTAGVLLPGVVGHWPRALRPVRGPAQYVGAIRAFLAAVPEFTGEVADAMVEGDRAFVRWVGRGRPVVGPAVLTGVDCIHLKDGFVHENFIHSDHPVFGHLAAAGALDGAAE